MHPLATERFLTAHLERIVSRAQELQWQIDHRGAVVVVRMVHRPTNETFRLVLVADEYPLLPVAAEFLPTPDQPLMAKWPNDGNFVFRTASPRPFICISGVRSFAPDPTEAVLTMGLDEIHVGAVLSNIDKAIHTDRYQGPVFLPVA